MKFFNKQEQVIDIQLTQYGKYLLSNGKFKPVYYAFFDDGILYDPEYGFGPQEQKDIQKRIKTDTPQLEGQYNFRGVEAETRKANESIRSDAEWEKKYFEDLTIRPPDTTSDNEYALQNIIGSSDLNSEFVPSWDVQFLMGQVSSSARTTSWTKEQTGSVINTPQVRVEDVVYKTAIKQLTDASQVAEDADSDVYGNEYIDVIASDGGILLDIGEENINFEKDGYEIEVYEVAEEKLCEGKAGTRQILTPLYFVKYPEQIKDGILLDTASPIDELDIPGISEYELDPRYAEYFLEIDVDNEIDKDIICERTSDRTLGIYSTRFLDCEDSDKKKEIEARNIYNTDITEEDLKDC
tara:strand:+ start:3756 stop:4814 length:1059 start_codon:yes stop_codon:yes gene_type:complete